MTTINAASIAKRTVRKTRGPRPKDVKRNIERYKADPVAFMREVLHMELAPYQEDIARLFVAKHRIAVRALHGVGKTAIAAGLICWAIGTADVDTKIVTTAGAWRQLKFFLWPEIRKWALKGDWSKVGLQMRLDREVFDLWIKTDNALAFGAASDDPSLIEGAHATRIFYFFRRGESHQRADLGCSGGRVQHGRSLRVRGQHTGRIVGPLLRDSQPRQGAGKLGHAARQPDRSYRGRTREPRMGRGA